jgi:hypothetical protein
MKVKELIEFLKDFDADHEVYVVNIDGIDCEIDYMDQYKDGPIKVYVGEDIDDE